MLKISAKGNWLKDFEFYKDLKKSQDTTLLFILEVGLLFFSTYILFWICKNVFTQILRFLAKKTKFGWDDIMVKNRVFQTMTYLIPIVYFRNALPHLLPDFKATAGFLDTAANIAFVLIFVLLINRILDAIGQIINSKNSEQNLAITSFVQITKIANFFLATVIIMSVVLKMDIWQILTGLSAVATLILLIFRDAILGFVSGIQIASSKMMNVGDWISVPKHNVEGNILEINLISVKIENFDKSISTVPTYDMISTAVINYKPMQKTNTRRIKRSIIFKSSSFEFLSVAQIAKLKESVYLKDYITNVEKEIESYNASMDEDDVYNLDRRRMTNIGTFRIYVLEYLKHSNDISKRDTIMVRQLEANEKGLPLEIYCFAKTADWQTYETIQADIFDHVLTVANEFNLEVSQVLTS